MELGFARAYNKVTWDIMFEAMDAMDSPQVHCHDQNFLSKYKCSG